MQNRFVEWLVDTLRGDVVTATFLVTAPAHTRVRADLYVAGVDFHDDRVATFDWWFRARATRRAWERFAAHSREQLLQLEVVAG